MREAVVKGEAAEKQWRILHKQYAEKYPEDFAEAKSWAEKQELPKNWDEVLPKFEGEEKVATRGSSGKVLNALAEKVGNLMGGSADLGPSNKTEIKGSPFFQPGTYEGRNIHFGVREHAMGCIMNGMALSKGLIPYGGTFLIFSDYVRPAIRLAALMKLQVIYIFTHDSIGVGEDGPTHQSIEQLASLRAIPNVTVIRPADATETSTAWQAALENREGPTLLILTRQGLPVINRSEYPVAAELLKGAYVLKDFSPDPDLLIAATGSEIALALESAQALTDNGYKVRVVNMPSWELFEAQSAEYKKSVFPENITKRVSIEAGATTGWHKYVGREGLTIGLDHFGASAPANILFEKFGLSKDAVVQKVETWLKS